MSKRISLLKWSHIWTLCYWAIFKPYKVMTMKWYEDKGMVDLFAFRIAKRMTKAEYKIMLNIEPNDERCDTTEDAQ